MKIHALFLSTILLASTICFADDVLDGRMFFASRSFAAASQQFVFVTPNNLFKLPRVSISIAAQTTNASTATIEWYESTSFAAASLGTALTMYNVNRDSGTLPSSAISHSPLEFTTTGATAMPTMVVPQNQLYIGSRAAFNPVETSGFVFKKNKQYYFLITPSNATATYQVRFDWKE